MMGDGNWIAGYEKALADMEELEAMKRKQIPIFQPNQIGISPPPSIYPIPYIQPSPSIFTPFNPKPINNPPLFPRKKFHCPRCGGPHHPDLGCPIRFRY
jgi:hypothetical protein